jgi:hypothetical protein
MRKKESEENVVSPPAKPVTQNFPFLLRISTEGYLRESAK